MKYLVCRLDAVRPAGQMRTSNHFPMVVETDWYSIGGTPENWAELVTRKALDSISCDYYPNHEYLVVPMISPAVVSFRKPQPQYEVHIRHF